MSDSKKSRRSLPKAQGESSAVQQVAPGAVGEEPTGDSDPSWDSETPRTAEGQSPVVCAVGAANALSRLLRGLPADTNVAVVLVPDVTSRDGGEVGDAGAIVEELARESNLPLSELRAGAQLKPGVAFIAPRGALATLVRGAVQLAPQPTGHPMVADVLLRSIARELKSNAVGVVVSGDGCDGALGLKELKEEGGITFAQDPGEAELPAKPRSAVDTGRVDFILGLEEIAAELARIGRQGHDPAPTHRSGPAPGSDQEIGKILRALHTATGVDFTQYKKTTLKRRIARRMMLRRLDTLEDYLAYLDTNTSEVNDLYQDILIKVTSFFRDPDAFAALKTHALPVLTHRRPPESPLRVWVPGCSSGEEVYSLAISLIEFLEVAPDARKIQIFGTDISEAAIQKAREGIYLENIALDVAPGRLRRFFVAGNGFYQVAKSIRDLCIFARHNAATDPPFSRVDLISCRNLMIYLEPSLQRRLLHTFHYALTATGFLMLGASEGVTTLPDLFGVVDKTHRIFCKRPSAARSLAFFAAPSDGVGERPGTAVRPAQVAHEAGSTEDIRVEVDRLVLSSLSPAGVVVDEAMQIVQFRGKTGPYLEPAPGDASLNLFKMAREGLELDLRTAIHAAMKSDAVARRDDIAVRRGDQVRRVNVEVWPLKTRLRQGRCFLVVFTEAPLPERGPLPSEPARPAPAGEPGAVVLQNEVATTKEYLQAIIEELEATNEELKSANEEILSSNEELHSINEELETAKEDLQSTNEELTTVNEELHTINADLGVANDDLSNLLTSVNIPILMLGADLRIRRFTPAAEKLVRLTHADVGRPLRDIRQRITGIEVDPLVDEVMDTMHTIERHVQDAQGRWYVMRIRPYRTAENKLDGAVICWLEIDALKRAERELAAEQRRMSMVIEAIRQPLLLLDGDLRVRAVSRRYCEVFGVSLTDLEGRPISAAEKGWSAASFEERLRDVIEQRSAMVDVRFEANLARAGQRTLSLSAFRVPPAEGSAPSVLLAIDDPSGSDAALGPG